MTERQTRWLLIFLLTGQLVLLSLQASDPAGERSLLESAAVRAMAPLPRAVASIADAAASVSRRFALRRRLLEENARLRGELDALRRERLGLYALEHDLQRLAGAVRYARPREGGLLVADVVYIDHASWLQTLLIHVASAKVEVNQAVVAPEGVVGRVILRSGPYAKVQLVTDRAASVGAMIARTRRQGVARGAGGGLLQLDFVPLQADVRVGDRIVTAGIDGVYARGLPLGTVSRVEPGDELFHSIEVQPAVDFGVLDQVYVLDREPVPGELKEARADAQP